VEARYRSGPDQLSRLVEIQRGILRDAVDLLVPGGAILYSTCSIEREENDEQVAWAEREIGLVGSDAKQTMPRGLPGESGAGYHDGAFSVVLRRRG
jgi:16S rRNA C967 or C1407 C5-methylase (RsmB/RsmF family)